MPCAGPRVLFTASLNRSGSTLLEFVLASLPGTVGVGELKPVFVALTAGRGLHSMRCQCGQDAPDCPLWSAVAARVQDGPVPDRTAFYSHVLWAVHAVFGRETVLIDSSKRTRFLQALARVSPSADIRVIRLVRDVRGWANSMHSYEVPSPEGSAAARRLRRTHPYLMLNWYRRNRAMDDEVEALGLPTFRLGYEQYATDPRRYVTEIAAFAGLDAVNPGVIDQPKSHMIAGNVMREDPDRRSRITYDTRWMATSGWLPAAILLPPVMRYNTRAVYEAGGAA